MDGLLRGAAAPPSPHLRLLQSLTRAVAGGPPQIFYGLTLWDSLSGVAGVVACFLRPAKRKDD